MDGAVKIRVWVGVRMDEGVGLGMGVVWDCLGWSGWVWVDENVVGYE